MGHLNFLCLSYPIHETGLFILAYLSVFVRVTFLMCQLSNAPSRYVHSLTWEPGSVTPHGESPDSLPGLVNNSPWEGGAHEWDHLTVPVARLAATRAGVDH